MKDIYYGLRLHFLYRCIFSDTQRIPCMWYIGSEWFLKDKLKGMWMYFLLFIIFELLPLILNQKKYWEPLCVCMNTVKCLPREHLVQMLFVEAASLASRGLPHLYFFRKVLYHSYQLSLSSDRWASFSFEQFLPSLLLTFISFTLLLLLQIMKELRTGEGVKFSEYPSQSALLCIIAVN